MGGGGMKKELSTKIAQNYGGGGYKKKLSTKNWLKLLGGWQ